MSAFKRSRLSVTISFRVTKEEHALLKEKAAERGIDLVDVIREALDRYFAARNKTDPPLPAPPENVLVNEAERKTRPKNR